MELMTGIRFGVHQMGIKFRITGFHSLDPEAKAMPQDITPLPPGHRLRLPSAGS